MDGKIERKKDRETLEVQRPLKNRFSPKTFFSRGILSIPTWGCYDFSCF